MVGLLRRCHFAKLSWGICCSHVKPQNFGISPKPGNQLSMSYKLQPCSLCGDFYPLEANMHFLWGRFRLPKGNNCSPALLSLILNHQNYFDVKYQSGKLLSYLTVGNLLHHSLTKASCGEKSTKRADRWGLELKIWLNQLKNLIALVPSHLASVALEKISCGDRKKRWKLDPCWCFLLCHALFCKTLQLCTCVYIHLCNMYINTKSERARKKQE